MSTPKIMSENEIHAFGVEVVASQIQKDGFIIEGINVNMSQNPQIIARKESRLAFIAVRTACYPRKGTLEENVHFQMIEHSEKHNAIPYFASVGISNASARSEKEMGIPVKGAGFHISFEGLLIVTRSDRVRILKEK